MTVLQDAALLGFVALTIAAVLHLRRRRSRPAAFLVAAFGVMAAVLVSGRLGLAGLDGVGPIVSRITVVVLAAFPWFLAAFAWSFERRTPRWLQAAAVVVLGLGLWGAALAPFPDPPDRSLVEELYVLVFIGVWGALLVAAGVRLWTAGGRQRLVRARMRLMAGGMLTMTVALFVSVGGSGTDDELVRGLAQLLVVVSAALFVAGFAPPLPLRVWWRRRANELFQRMQLALIAASTPAEVGQAVVPTLAELLGGAVVLVGPDRQVLASAQLEPDRAAALARQLSTGGTLDDTLVVPVDSSWLLIRSNPYTPVFGQDEQQLVTGFSLQVRMALERAELFTANLAAQEATERARAELETMLYGLSHDLRSPAVAIAGFASLLEEVDDEETRRDMLGRIQASTAYLNDLVDALLELSRIGRAQDEVAPVDLGEVARAVAHRFEVTHPAVTVVTADPLPVVLLNPGRAEQLLDNLVGNAVKHGGRDDLTVAISARPRTGGPGDGIELVVADDGRGVRAEDRERIFGLFARGSDAGGKGSGLGLGMVQRIAEINGGHVRLDPQEPGATFVVWFPAAVVVDPRVVDPRTPAASPVADHGRPTDDRPATSV